ncbi:hypothetical protein D8B34_27445, partial [Verminephrobacter eiseniae]|nr:hypothetical protein [Verminephrobacter eiseniae]
MRKLGERLRERHHITVRSATRQDLKHNLEEVRQLFNSSFAKNYEVAPISAPVFGFQVDAVRPFVDLDGIRIIEVAGKPTAFFLILPDLNELLSKFKGSIGLFDLIRLPLYKRNIRKCVIALIGVDPDLHGKGLGRVIAEEIIYYYFVSLNHLPKSDYMRSCHGNFLETGMARRTGRSELKLSQEHKVMLKELA